MALTLAGALVWDGCAPEPSPSSVHVAGGQIVEAAPEGATVIDVSGCTVMPGLIEAHAHLCWNAGEDWRAVYDREAARPERLMLRMAGNARRMLDAGITTVRDLGSPTRASVELREAIRDGLVRGPELLVAGAPITTTGGHCWYLGGEADGELGVRVAVRQRVREGADWIKVMASGGNMTPGSNPLRAQYSVTELRAAVEEAHRLGRRVAAHGHGSEGIRAAVEAGVDMIEHCTFQTPDGSEKDDAVIEEIARKGIVVSPTIVGRIGGHEGDDRFRRRAELLRAMVDAGCRMLMSTDCGIPHTPHDYLGRSMAVMQRLTGLTSVEVLRLGTSRSAELLGLDDRGVVEAGRRADLLVVEGDPTKELGALERVRLVVAGGKVAYRAT
jgi:imidazolonepropionase-like amidohydrolase